MTEIIKNVNSRELDPEIERLLWQRNLDRAEQRARKKVILRKNSLNLYSLALALATIGFLKNNSRKKTSAIKYYKEIIKLFPLSLHAYLAKARLYEEKKHLKKALPFYKQAFRKYPTARNAVHIGNIYRQLHRKSLAKKYYRLAEKLEKGSAVHHLTAISKENKR